MQSVTPHSFTAILLLWVFYRLFSWDNVVKASIKLTSLEVLLLLSSRNCCRVTTSLPGEPVLMCLPRASSVSGVLCCSTGLDLVWPLKYWMGLLLLLDHASCSCSRLNSPLLWLWGLLWLWIAPALRQMAFSDSIGIYGSCWTVQTMLTSETVSDSIIKAHLKY